MMATTLSLSAAAQPKVTVCHGAAAGHGRVLEVAESAVAEHVGHGDTPTSLPKGAVCTADEWVPM